MSTGPYPVRLLLLDDEKSIHKSARRLASGLSEAVEIVSAITVTEAADSIRNRYFDLVLIDLVGADGSLAGLELLRFLRLNRISSDVVVMTHVDLGLSYSTVMAALASHSQPRVVRFVDKVQSSNFLSDALEYTLARLRRLACTIDNPEALSQLLDERRTRFQDLDSLPLRSSLAEVTMEVERLCGEMFGGLPAEASRKTELSVSFAPLGRLGLSAAVVTRALVRVGFDGAVSPEPYECVIKVGPRSELLEEANRYLEFVRFGVRLEERVELLALTSGDSLAAVVYSLAGGTRGPVLTLDELMARNPPAARATIERLFQSSYWYSVPAGFVPPREFFRETYRVDFAKAYDDALPAIRTACASAGASVETDGDRASVILKGGARTFLPGRQYTGTGEMLLPRPWCLVHGDMHGGNVMAEMTDVDTDQEVGRVCLIDYRQAGPGPRCVDAAALECAVRLADASRLEHALGSDMARSKALGRLREERALLDRIWRPRSMLALHYPFAERSEWIELVESVVFGVTNLFSRLQSEAGPITDREYQETCLLYGLRQLRYPLGAVARLRIVAWVGAIYDYLSEADGEVTRE